MSKKESTKEYKARLNNALEGLEHELKGEMGLVKKTGKRVLKNSAIIAGGGLVVYSIFSLLTSSKKKSKVNKPANTSSTFSGKAKGILLALLLELIKHQLTDIIKHKSNDSRSPE